MGKSVKVLSPCFQAFSADFGKYRKGLIFIPEGGILPVSFSDEGKHAVRIPVHREREKVQARSEALIRYHSRMESGRRPIKRLNEWFYEQAGWNRECFTSIRPGTEMQGGCFFVQTPGNKKEGIP